MRAACEAVIAAPCGKRCARERVSANAKEGEKEEALILCAVINAQVTSTIL
jgi:hypothetical protein